MAPSLSMRAVNKSAWIQISSSLSTLRLQPLSFFNVRTVPPPPLPATNAKIFKYVRSSKAVRSHVVFRPLCPRSTLIFPAANSDLTFQSTWLPALFWDARISPHLPVANPTITSHTPLLHRCNIEIFPFVLITTPYTGDKLFYNTVSNTSHPPAFSHLPPPPPQPSPKRNT
jgi:hypothetical protein